MRVLFSNKGFERLRGIIETLFENHEVRYANILEDPHSLGWAEVLVKGTEPFTAEMLAHAPNLKMLCQWGVGLEGIDIEACTSRGIYVCNVPSGNTGNAEGVAEIALLHMLLLAKGYNKSQENLRKGKLFSPRGLTIWKKRVCIVGLGNVGITLAKRLSSFDVAMVGVNRSWKDIFSSLPLERFYTLDKLSDAVRGCRFVIVTVALTPQTKGLIGEEVLGSMDENAFLINVARADIVERKALERALMEKRIAGCGLDVFWQEPPDQEDPLLSMSNVYVTPHIGGTNDEALKGIPAYIAQNVDRLSKGELPLSCVNIKSH
jgi:phosphoglycerate dehydrogenase-like enzyme